jgi:hypothetical protein
LPPIDDVSADRLKFGHELRAPDDVDEIGDAGSEPRQNLRSAPQGDMRGDLPPSILQPKRKDYVMTLSSGIVILTGGLAVPLRRRPAGHRRLGYRAAGRHQYGVRRLGADRDMLVAV